MSRARLCACGCGQPVTGRRSRRFYSDACRKRFSRGSATHRSGSQPAATARESRTDGNPAPAIPGVRESDTKPREVFCAGCGSLMLRLEGPLPVAAYCRECVPGG